MKRLFTNIDVIVTMNDEGHELKQQDVLVDDGLITAIGSSIECDDCEKVDLSGCILTPGLVNTHHHLYQTLTRAVPECQDALLFGWLQTLYPIWGRMTPKHFQTAVQTGVAELLLSGCTMTSDHHYIFPNGTKLDDSIEAATALGIRFHATRGAMSIGESDGGLPPDALVEKEPAILTDMIRVIDQYHDARPNAKLRVGVAPCSPFSVSRELMRDAAILARDKGVMMHTHLAENEEDIAYSLEKFGVRPGDYAQELGWVGDDVWHAHCVQLDDSEIDLFARTKTGVAHCPCSNCRLGSGIAPVRKMMDRGVPVGLGVDGSASNDSGHLLGEARQAMLLQRVSKGADAFSARRALRLATRGGAEILGRGDVLGQVKVGMRADFAIWEIKQMGMAGAWDPVAGLVLCGPFSPKQVIVDGVDLVSQYQLVSGDMISIQNAQSNALSELMD